MSFIPFRRMQLSFPSAYKDEWARKMFHQKSLKTHLFDAPKTAPGGTQIHLKTV